MKKKVTEVTCTIELLKDCNSLETKETSNEESTVNEREHLQ